MCQSTGLWLSQDRVILTFPMSAFFVLAFYHDMKEFSVSDYRVRQIEAHSVLDILDKSAVEIPKSELGFRGIAYFSQEVPSDVTARIVADFLKNRRPKAEEMEFTVDGKRELPQGTIWDDADVVSLQFTVYQRVNKLKLAGLILGSVFDLGPYHSRFHFNFRMDFQRLQRAVTSRQGCGMQCP